MVDAYTRDVLMLVIPGGISLIGIIVSGVIAIQLARVKTTVNENVQKLEVVAKGVDGLTTKLVDAEGAKASLIATAAEKVAQADRENQQAKGAAAARQADAGAKASVPLTMASPPPEGTSTPPPAGGQP